MGSILLIALIVVPIAEIALFIEVGGFLGFWPTMSIIILTALAGTALLRQQGLAELAARLQADHAEMTRLWAALRPPLLAWAAGKAADLPDDLLHSYTTIYAAHMPLEEEQAFPSAAANLDEATLKFIGVEMTARRQGSRQ